jgi:crotonobetainyl-CoA:carnitine CoA-transferase CaiB-like acyl-CoA transferase
MSQPVLEGLTVLEFGAGSHAAALAGVLLADNGARVIKVEPPEGDRLRTDSPSAHLVFNRGKESVVADLRTAEGREQARDLAARADVVIAAFEPGVDERFGIDYATLRELNPLLVHCSINGFGADSPYAGIKAYEHVVQAKSGLMSLGQGSQFGYRPGPIFGSAPIAGTGTGHLAAAGILAALVARQQTGRGQQLEVPMFFGAQAADYFGLMTWQLATGKVSPPPARVSSAGSASRKTIVASRLNYLPCTKDGRFVFFTAMMPHQARAVLRALGIEHILEQPRYANAPFFESADDGQAWEDEIWDAFRTKTFAEWDPILRAERDVAYELARTSEEGLDHPQIRHNGDVLTLDAPGVGPVEQVGPIAHFRTTPARVRRSAPALGENSGQVTGPAEVSGNGTVPEHPLAGITLVEFGYFFAMPFATAILASLGARVIKIEDRGGDPMRFSFGAPESGAARVMEGKESLTVDLRTPEGRQLAHEVIAKADAFVNGFRSGIAERQGLDYETLREINPRLVYLHASGYGVDGEFAGRPIFAQTAEAVAGSLHRNAGFWLDPALSEGMSATEVQAVILPRLRTIVDGDSNAALGALTALSLALYNQLLTGEGQFVSTSMIGGNLWAYADDAVRYEGKQPLPMTDPELNGNSALYRLYEAAGGWVFLAASRQHEWEALVSVLGRPELATDARFVSVPDRAANDESLAAELERTFATRKADEWESELVAQGVACVEAYPGTMSEFTGTDPVIRQTGLAAEVDHPSFGRMVRHGLPVRLSETPGRLAPGCVLGQHTRAILEELGYSPERIAELEDKQVVLTLPSD